MQQERAMHAARNLGPATVRPGGGHYIDVVWHGGQGDLQVRRHSGNRRCCQIPDAGAEGVDQAVRTAQNALMQSGRTKFFFAWRGQHDTQHQEEAAVRQKVLSDRPTLFYESKAAEALSRTPGKRRDFYRVA
jgi:hypothetical protein